MKLILANIVLSAILLAWASMDARAAQDKGNTLMRQAGNGKLRVIYNLDATEFYNGTFGPVKPETIDKFVDDHAAIGVTDLFINANDQRTSYRSKVWESTWDGYDPSLGADQPFFAGIDPERKWESSLMIETYNLYKQGCDYPKRMIDRCRKDKISPWISIRMNDCHYPEWPNHPYHSTFWKEHPEWRLPYGLDYEQPQVREHYMKLIKEVCANYDIDGLELDYLRFWLYFRPGREHEGAKLMNEFVKHVRTVTNQAAKRLGHPVKLAVRVPSTPWISRMHGLEAVEWAKAGLVDLIIASPFWPSINSDMPIETWKGALIGTNVPVAFGLEACIDAGSGIRNSSPEEMRGAALSGLQRGADLLYFFNLFTNPYQSWPRKDYNQIVKDAGSYSKLSAAPRRHPITITRPFAAGEPGVANRLPYTGTNGVFRIPIGPKPTAKQTASVELVVKDSEEPFEVLVNSAPCKFTGMQTPDHLVAIKITNEPKRHVYQIPPEAIADGYNLVEVNSKQAVTLTWVEISVR